MLFTKKLFRTCHYIPAQNKHVNHLYIAILHISVLCLTLFLEIIPTPHCTCMPEAGMITMGVTSHAEKSEYMRESDDFRCQSAEPFLNFKSMC